MKEDRPGKSKLVIVLLAILGFLGVGAIGSALIKGVKVTKVVKSANTFNRALKPGRSTPGAIDYAKGSHSVADKANIISGINNRKNEDENHRSKYGE